MRLLIVLTKKHDTDMADATIMVSKPFQLNSINTLLWKPDITIWTFKHAVNKIKHLKCVPVEEWLFWMIVWYASAIFVAFYQIPDKAGMVIIVTDQGY